MASQLLSRGGVGELKTKAAIEAAQDPGSNVGAEDAEKIMINEAKKAGVPALEFDPDASPEEKAAQARAVRYTHLVRKSSRSLIAPNSVCLRVFTMSRNPKLWN